MLALPSNAVASRGEARDRPIPTAAPGHAPACPALDRSADCRISFGARPSTPSARRFALRVVSYRSFAAALGLAVAIAAAGSATAPAAQSHEGIGLERFMYALGQVESGGSYTARNSSTGAYGRYQIIPSSWRAWALEVLGNAYAPMTPANQDKVAAYKLHQAYHRVGSWPPVAYWWLTGRINTNRSTWSSFARSYVDKIMAIYYRTSSVSGTVSSSTYRNVYYQETYQYIRWGGTWHNSARTWYSGGAARFSDTAGSWMEFRFTGRGVLWFGQKGPGAGRARVYVDGTYVRTVDAGSSTWVASTPLFSKSWTGSGTHVLKVVALGTAGRPSVVVDAFRVTK
jgi:Transglycosylase-like domain